MQVQVHRTIIIIQANDGFSRHKEVGEKLGSPESYNEKCHNEQQRVKITIFLILKRFLRSI